VQAYVETIGLLQQGTPKKGPQTLQQHFCPEHSLHMQDPLLKNAGQREVADSSGI
jgi:hypothetical protein